jgi:hypothetical protein
VDRLNRSLTDLSAQACPRRSVSCSFFSRAASFSLLTGRFLSAGGLTSNFFSLSDHSQACSGSRRHAIFFGLRCALASVRAFFSGSSSSFLFHPAVHAMSGRAQNFFLDASAQRCQPARQNFLFGGCPVASCYAHRTFFLWCPVSSCCACRNFFFSVRSLLHSPSGRHDADLFFLLLTAMQACQGRQRFFSPLSSRFRSTAAARTDFLWSQPHSTAVCAAFCFCVRSLSAVLTARAVTFL